ncbi:putative ankyrin repeat domain [Aspergillus nomiae NRRL 13137]|uniref:Putative ankyrin repeat domain n=1 Tax=Aspergillus nomiae NRRL (strain ATCC 15546 / NRRL 13137 / CBS 260.88 / M93) TaxID=1509407 RepID=A0A0L1J4G8_ASPN3|nr:putative ankyrin repeat domain [Aspergillus nomiae NRRL 13137]KNG86706.1 putative ankyrin repeat domain [Aspergillus nomiae NRRL 13137]
MSLLHLPSELLLMIIEELDSEKDILSFLLTSRRIYAIQQGGPLYNHNIRFSGSSALRWYSARGHKSAVEALLQKGANIECKSEDGCTALAYAARMEHDDVLMLLFEKGSDQKFKGTEYDQEQLLIAAEVGYSGFVNLLLERGTDLECKDYNNNTPLGIAACKGHENVARLLLEKGADMESKDSYGVTPLKAAARAGHESMVKLLLEKGSNIESREFGSWTPLTVAVFSEYEGIVKLLLNNGSNIESEDDLGWTPLAYAAMQGNEQVIKLLLYNGAALERSSCTFERVTQMRCLLN